MPSVALSALALRARAWGVQTWWRDLDGRRHEVSGDTLEAVLEVLTPEPDSRPPGRSDRPLVLSQLDATAGLPQGVVATEDGTELRLHGGERSASLPLGYHLLRAGGRERALVIGPGRCVLPGAPRAWGLAVQLYSVPSERNWGMGDLGDLRALAAWSATLGAGLLLLNPLHFSRPAPPVPASPYSPGSRHFRDPIYLRVEDVPGAAALGVHPPAAGARPELIDRDRVLAAKLDALGRLWPAFRDNRDFIAWRTRRDDDLEAFATWCALAEVHGNAWPNWPAELRDRHSAAVAREGVRQGDRVGFHAWLQWLIARQLDAAAAELPLLHDLAIGVDPAGVEAWLDGPVLAQGVHIGAQPDLFNASGQDWGILPFDPWKLRAAGYSPFAATLRACMAGGAGLRVDHVMGLSRLFWIPPGGSPRDGAYVRYPADDLFEVLALESVRAGAFVVGEDLGTVESSVRRQMAARNVLSYRLLWFERRRPEHWPERALGAVTTHDLPTVAGLWTGSDLRDQVAAGTRPDPARTAQLRRRLQRLAGVGAEATVDQAVAAAYATLASAPSMLLVATLEDLLGVEHRPNLPGTMPDDWPNWSRPLPRTLEQIREEPRAAMLAPLLARD